MWYHYYIYTPKKIVTRTLQQITVKNVSIFTIYTGFHPEGTILGGKLQEVGVALYTFLYNCPNFFLGGGGGELPPALPPG